ncbi:hypothetical protein EDB83DRAFT_2679283 [Lactarius deliciosus]|nr:hypothetical protein EDB83DRAFT_2679283 [Lactarius deliciosus]
MLRCGSEEPGKGLCRPGAVERLTDDVLLEIFGFYRDAAKEFLDRPWRWHTLVHVCRSWRRIVFASPRRLDLQLLCTVGTPVRKYLGCWPATLPIVIKYRSQWNSLASSPEDEDNIFAALDHPSRVCSIELVAASSFINEIFGLMQKRFPASTDLRLSSPDPGVQICFHSSPLLSGVKRLSIDSPPKDPDWLDDAGVEEWTRIFPSFVAVEELYVSEPLGQHVAQALALPRTAGQAEMLPALRSVFYEGPQEFALTPEILKPLSPPAGSPIAP